MSTRKLLPLVGVLGVAAAWLGHARQDPARLTFLAVGQGDCAVFQYEGRTVLIDAGPATPTFDAGTRIVLPRLRALGVERVDLLLLTHPDLDHVGGVPALLAAHPEAKVGISAAYRADPEMRNHLHRWRLPEGRIVWLPPEARLAVGDFGLRLHAPPLAPGADSNDGSLFVRIAGQGATAVLTGDAPAAAENQALRTGDWSAQVLKAGHHGSRTATGDPFLRAVRPAYLVISCGRANPYGHPAPEVLDRAARYRLQLARTDREGDVEFEVRDGRFVRIR
jgi:competence protein ComEC